MHRDFDDLFELTSEQLIAELASQRAHAQAQKKLLGEIMAFYFETTPDKIEQEYDDTQQVYLELANDYKHNDQPALVTLMHLSLSTRAHLETVLHYSSRILAQLRDSDPDKVLLEMYSHRRKVVLDLLNNSIDGEREI
ncbi:MAG: hypothetical protein ROO71_08860 [Balneola sp.]